MAGLGTAALALPLRDVRAAEIRRPNVIVIFSDDQGWGEISCNARTDAPTPNIDSIAANGVRFTDGYVSCPVCSPSRAGLLTGRYQQRFGHYGNPQPALDRKQWGLPLDQKTMADYMKELGYATGAIGKWHLGDIAAYHPNRRGFDEFFGFIGGAHPYLNPTINSFNTIQRNGKPVDEKEYLTDAFAREAVSFIERHKARPFFLYLPFNAVHAPLDIPPKLADAFPEIKDPKRRAYARMQKSMDDAVGQVLAKVRELDLEHDTLIFFVGDNGGPTPGTTSSNGPFKGYKTQVFEGGIRVPFVAQWRGHIAEGKVESRPVISLDILPTALAAAAGKPAANVDGVNLLPYLEGNRTGRPHASLCWKFAGQSAIRMGDWKLAQHEKHGVRLYNLAEDPGEKKNLAAANPERVKQLQKVWEDWDAGNVKPLWAAKQDAPWIDDLW